MRGVRLHLEYEKPETIQQWHRIESTIVMFGGSRILAKDVAQSRLEEVEARLKNSPNDQSLEKELINNLDENSYSELIKLKNQLNRE